MENSKKLMFMAMLTVALGPVASVYAMDGADEERKEAVGVFESEERARAIAGGLVAKKEADELKKRAEELSDDEFSAIVHRIYRMCKQGNFDEAGSCISGLSKEVRTEVINSIFTWIYYMKRPSYQLATIQLLLSQGANPNTLDLSGNNLLQSILIQGLEAAQKNPSVIHNHYLSDIVQAFVVGGIDVNHKNDAGHTALELSANGEVISTPTIAYQYRTVKRAFNETLRAQKRCCRDALEHVLPPVLCNIVSEYHDVSEIDFNNERMRGEYEPTRIMDRIRLNGMVNDLAGGLALSLVATAIPMAHTTTQVYGSGSWLNASYVNTDTSFAFDGKIFGLIPAGLVYQMGCRKIHALLDNRVSAEDFTVIKKGVTGCVALSILLGVFYKKCSSSEEHFPLSEILEHFSPSEILTELKFN